MKFVSGLLISIIILLSTVSCNVSDTSANFQTPTTSNGPGPHPTLRQSQEEVPFKILVPDHLPNGVSFKNADIEAGTGYVLKPKGKVVILIFSNGKVGFTVVEQQGKMGHLDRGINIKKLKINNNEAEYSNEIKQFDPTLLWQKRNVVCRIYTNIRSSFANENGLKTIAESFK